MNTSDVEYSTDVRRINIKSLAVLYESVGFGTRENYVQPDVSMDKIFGPNVFGFFAFYDGTLIGMARVFSDDCLCSWIAELCVIPEWQKKGIGRALLDRVNHRFAHTALYAEAFTGQESFFERSAIRPQSKLTACGRAPLMNEEGHAINVTG